MYLLERTWNKKYIKEFLLFVGLYIISIYIMYFTTKPIQLAFIIVLLLVFIRSKNNYFWLAFFFILFQAPAGIFSGGMSDFYGRLPLFTLLTGASFTTIEIFVFIAFIKALLMKTPVDIPFKIPLQCLAFYLIFVVIQSFLFGIGSSTIIYTCRILLFLTLFYTVPAFLKNREDYYFFILLVIPFIIVDFGGQLYELAAGHKPFKTLITDVQLLEASDTSGGLRTEISYFLNFLAILFSLFLLTLKERINKVLILAILSVSILSVLLTATRGWILSYGIMLILFFSLYINMIGKNIKWIFISFVILVIILYSVPEVKNQSVNALRRFSTMKSFFQGDITAEGTLSRLTNRGPLVMSYFYKNPLTGFGFSDTVNSDSHVGNQNLLMTTGIIGYSLFMFLWLNFSYKLLLTAKRLSYNNPYKKALKVLVIGLVGILIIHSTSTQIFGYDPGTQAQTKLFFLSLFFSFSGFFIKEAKDIELSIIKT